MNEHLAKRIHFYFFSLVYFFTCPLSLSLVMLFTWLHLIVLVLSDAHVPYIRILSIFTPENFFGLIKKCWRIKDFGKLYLLDLCVTLPVKLSATADGLIFSNNRINKLAKNHASIPLWFDLINICCANQIKYFIWNSFSITNWKNYLFNKY